MTVDYLLDNVWIVGDPAECVDTSSTRRAAASARGYRSPPTRTMPAGDHESLRLLMEQVAPRVAHLG